MTEFIPDKRRNVLPGIAPLKGDARTLTPTTNAAIEAHMSNAASGCVMLIGNGNSGANARLLRATEFNFNDETLIPGASYVATLTEEMLADNRTR